MSKKIKWGILGGSTILEAATGDALKSAANAEIYALASRRENRHQVLTEILGAYKKYNNYKELLSDPSIDAVYISLPNSHHKKWTIKALEAGKHVLCEKPLAPSEADVLEIVQAAKRNNRFVMEGFAFLHSPLMERIKKIVDQGRLGKLVFIDTHFYDEGLDEDNATIRRPNFGGSIYDISCYNTAFLYYLLEEEPERIQGFANFMKTNVDNYASFLFEYCNGLKASVRSFIGCSQRDDYVEIFGAKAKMIIPVEYNFAGTTNIKIKNLNGEEEKIEVSAPNNYVLEFEQFGRCISHGELPRVSTSFSILQARTLDRMLRIINY